MIDDRDIARWRLRSQRLVTPYADSAGEVVRHLLAVQAENPSQSAWAVASRTAAPDAADLSSLLDSGEVLRTHVLRPTWHYVAAEDAGWLIDLTAPRVRRSFAPGATGRDAEAGEILDALDGTALTRPEVADRLAEAGRPLSGHDLMLLLADLEMRRMVCSGAPRDGTHTYARYEQRVRRSREPDREEALAEVALRYVTGHGPATERDLAYWATLTLTDVRRGLGAVADRLETFEHGGRTYWHAPGEEPPASAQEPAGHLLQILDETYRGYQDSRMALDAAGAVPRDRERAIGMALHDGQLVAGMRRTLTDTTVAFDLTPYDSWSPAAHLAVQAAAERYARFLGREARLRVP